MSIMNSRTDTTDDGTARAPAGPHETGEPDEIGPVVFRTHGRVVEAELNRPDALNALNREVMELLVDRFERLDRDPGVGCFLITGAGRAFAAGADITELREQSYRSMTAENFFSPWDDFAAIRTPKVAAVGGYALGGGCELAMMCDVILAGERARFGQPEVKLGLIPGMGGTQRLTRLVGRARAMDLILTGRMMGATEAERAGLVSRVVADDDLRSEALLTATTIAGYSKHTVTVAVESVRQAERTSLTEGVLFERRSYYGLFDTPDAHEGMDAFVQKRDPVWGHDRE